MLNWFAAVPEPYSVVHVVQRLRHNFVCRVIVPIDYDAEAIYVNQV